VSGTNARLPLYLALAFAITWLCWWSLLRELPVGGSVFGSPWFTTLYVIGGFGPTIGAYLAVAATPREGTLSEYHARLFRWRVSPLWYVAVFALPPALAFMKEWIAIVAGAPGVAFAPVKPLSGVLSLFPLMIVGGGLEELGWRGVALPSLERRMPLLLAALVVGVIWAVWHLPLFYIHGVSQFGGDFPLFAFDVLAGGCLLAWVCAGTRSILLCILFHAAGNTATSMGLAVPDGNSRAAWIAAGVKFLIAVLLLMTVSGKRA
jgi:membrane protease YdiL (CAAX protease family)